jgi:hypothetical protein
MLLHVLCWQVELSEEAWLAAASGSSTAPQDAKGQCSSLLGRTVVMGLKE